MATLNPYLNFLGNTEEVFNFYRSVFGGEFQVVMRFKDMPAEMLANIPEDYYEKLMHISLPISGDSVLMGSDALESMGGPLIAGTNFTISISTKSQEETDKIFNGLSAGGVVTMPLQQTFWSASFGMFTDKFGVQWMVNYDINEQA
ncbi:glyoxalase [Mucilaginibacter sp. PPCGB 2223]|uniref:VOC family protein n=1 Tax=Mucilaginibacter sp. PPCGB 2223 TaxID=1886027 RepID=UPI0008250EF4|nr:VOC family protein [Mucilaginibacter sp. PPCGB 2223]OCX52331.1 glyoxalase [Mucilaginibacter sp. PPCGB 2223]